MDNGGSSIIGVIRELRAKAAEQLSGNSYYMVVQQLDALTSIPDLTPEMAEPVIGPIAGSAISGVRSGILVSATATIWSCSSSMH